uniref:interleukin-1 receptor type 2-like isoform X2 n=1 Tax=Pristiophorus japonicus TaxID=55135 RepID=UPI00398F4F8A
MTTSIYGNSLTGQETHWPVAMVMLMLLNGFVTAQNSRDGDKVQGSAPRGPPTITVPAAPTVNTELGRPLNLTCKAIIGSFKSSTIIYWLADQQFIEDAFVDGRVKEGEEIFRTKNRKLHIQRNLIFTTTVSEDFKTNFTCVVLSSSGSSIKNITLVRKESLSKTIAYKRKLEPRQRNGGRIEASIPGTH